MFEAGEETLPLRPGSERGLVLFASGVTGGRWIRLRHGARGRIGRVAIGKETADRAIEEVRRELKVKLNDTWLWDIFESGDRDQWNAERVARVAQRRCGGTHPATLARRHASRRPSPLPWPQDRIRFHFRFTRKGRVVRYPARGPESCSTLRRPAGSAGADPGLPGLAALARYPLTHCRWRVELEACNCGSEL